ncbi:uncharacterized protein LOC103577846 isoform X2 [Microplitis demolitor]|uniref:uncharacterized protein LOC103577846 isoform X2 n=1 Tax=Microplitis demolitor TaxID=69319 RepID=UPI0004CCB690|nr:uncharacterized protein LOC103577846 isoform X2 [Microplitis demolitor]
MNSTPPELSRNLALLEKIWFAGTLTDKVFKKKYNSNQIMAIDTSQACKEIKEIIKSRKEKVKSEYSLYLASHLGYGVTKLNNYQCLILEDRMTKLIKEVDASLKSDKDESTQLSGDGPLSSIDLQIPDIELSFDEHLPKDVNLLPDDNDDLYIAETARMEEVAGPNFGMMIVEDWNILLGTSTDTDSIRDAIRDLDMTFNEDLSDPTRTPKRLPNQINIETPSKRIRRTLDHSFGDDPSLVRTDLDGAEDSSVPVFESIQPMAMDVSVEIQPEQEAPAQEAPAQEAPVASVTEVSAGTLEDLPELIEELKVLAPKSRRRKKTGVIIDDITQIPGDIIRKSQQNNIYTVSFKAVRANPSQAWLSANDLFNRFATIGSRKFRSLGRPLMANFQQLKLGAAYNVRDVVRRASTERTAELTDGNRPIPSTVRNQTDKTAVNIEVPDHELSPQNQVAEEVTEPTEPFVEIPFDDTHPEPPAPIIDNSSQPPVTNTEATLEAAFVQLTTDAIDEESNESLMSGPPIRNNQSHSRSLSDKIIDIENIPVNKRLSPSPPYKWTKADLMAQIDMFVSQGHQIIRFDELISMDDNNSLGIIRLLFHLLSLATESKISLDQDDDETIWIQKN